ncbi:MAG: DUF5701 family protein [Pedococcus sp.]
MSAVGNLPSLHDQAERLIALGVPELADITAEELRAAGTVDCPDALLVIHPDRARASTLAPLLRRGDRDGFVVVDMTDVDEFTPIPGAAVPTGGVYLLGGVDRGDHLAGWSPDEALPAIVAEGRTPLTVGEGIQWVLQQPTALERNRCFMTIGSRRRKGETRLDSRTPAIWISNGTGRDGAAHRGAPKVGWCWARNRHSWLGFASATQRSVLPTLGAAQGVAAQPLSAAASVTATDQ